MPNIRIWQLSDLTITGTDPFSSNNVGQTGAIGSTFTIDPNFTHTTLDIDDGLIDNTFGEGDLTQQETDAVYTLNGVTYAFDTDVEPEYSYTVRPVGSTDPADEVTVTAVKIGGISGDIVGILSDGWLAPGVEYEIIGLETNSPSMPYSSIFVCFADGTRIATPGGAVPVEALAEGDLVLSSEGTANDILWIGRQKLEFRGMNDPYKPVLITAGALGAGMPKRNLVVSPQHRIALAGPVVERAFGTAPVFLAAKALCALPGVRVMRGKRAVTYHSILLRRHGTIMAEEIATESFYPGEFGLSVLDRTDRQRIRQVCPVIADDGPGQYGDPAFPVIPTGKAGRFLALHTGSCGFGIHAVPFDSRFVPEGRAPRIETPRDIRAFPGIKAPSAASIIAVE